MIRFQSLEGNNIGTILNFMSEFYAIDHYPFDALVTEKLFEEFIENENLGRCWLLFQDKKPVGYLILTFVFSFEYRGKIAFLDELYLQPKAQGQGIGKNAIAFAKAFCQKNNLQLIYLEVEAHNEKAQQLYLKNGFVNHNRKLMKYQL